MKITYRKEFSYHLHRDMEFKIYGHAGMPVLAFPSQDGRFFDFEDQGMIGSIASYIESGRIQVFCCDSNDVNSWSSTNWDHRKAIENQEAYFHYITEELCPRIYQINQEANGGLPQQNILTTGCSLGATHALNVLLRRPDIFSGCIALSGAYNSRYFFPDYWDDLTYANSPVDYLDGMPYSHPYVDLYRTKNIILCCGQGAWEHPMQEDAARMKELFAYKNIPAWVDFWGKDVCHDWSWWKQQLPYFMNYVC